MRSEYTGRTAATGWWRGGYVHLMPTYFPSDPDTGKKIHDAIVIEVIGNIQVFDNFVVVSPGSRWYFVSQVTGDSFGTEGEFMDIRIFPMWRVVSVALGDNYNEWKIGDDDV